MNAQTELLTTERTRTRSSSSAPIRSPRHAGANVGTILLPPRRQRGRARQRAKDVAPKPTSLFRQTTSYGFRHRALTTAIPGLTAVTYDDPNAFTFSGDPNSSVAVLGDGETATVLTRAAIKGTSYVLPSATPDIATALGAGSTLPHAQEREGGAKHHGAFAGLRRRCVGDAEMYDAVYLAPRPSRPSILPSPRGHEG